MSNLLKNYFSLIKPGIIFGNLITVCGGFFLASRGNIDLKLFAAIVSGISLIIACGCVFNNYIDRDIDPIMERTKRRALVLGNVSNANALALGAILGIGGALILYRWVNCLALILALFGLVVYVVIYSLWLKRNSVYGTLVGSFAGAVPPVVGYCGVTNCFDLAALTLFIMLSIWQMPHSYAIAIFRYNDYLAAKIPVLPVSSGLAKTKRHMLVYVVLFIIASLAMTFAGYTGYIYFATVILSGGLWLRLAIKGLSIHNDRFWARQMFGYSILVIMLVSLAMAVDYIRY